MAPSTRRTAANPADDGGGSEEERFVSDTEAAGADRDDPAAIQLTREHAAVPNPPYMPNRQAETPRAPGVTPSVRATPFRTAADREPSCIPRPIGIEEEPVDPEDNEINENLFISGEQAVEYVRWSMEINKKGDISSATVKTPLRGRKDYREWSSCMMEVLTSMRVVRFVLRTCECPSGI